MDRFDVQIIKTKLAPPRIVGDPQRRAELLASLQERRDKRLTVIVGPAGCGKTTLVALWRQELVTSGHAVCWYNINKDDSDIPQFLSYLVAALQTVESGCGEAALKLYNHSGGRSTEAFFAGLVNDLFELKAPVHLFLEDMHAVAGSEIPALLERLLEMAPNHLRVVITSRSLPAMDYVRWRVLDELNELSFSDLRFSLQESSAFLRSQGLTGLGPSQLHRLHTLADGWAAGLQLFAYSLKKAKDPAAYIDRLRGALTPSKEASLAKYLNDVIRPILTEEELDFLVRTSACRRFNAELCALVTGNSEASRLLERFTADSLFVIPIDTDDGQQWYRFHKIFSKFLKERLLQLPPEELQRINRAASQWFAEQGLRIEAIRHAVYAGDIASCVDLIERSARALVASSQSTQLLKWFNLVPREVTLQRLQLLLCVAWANLSCGRREDFEWCMAAITRLPQATVPDVAFELVLLRAFRLIRQDDTAAALELLEPYLAAPPKANPFVLHGLFLLSGLALVYADEFERTRDLARYCRQELLRRSVAPNMPIMDAAVGLSLLLQGDVRAAKAVLVEAQRSIRRDYIGTDPMAFLACYLAEAHYQLDELEEAQAMVAEYGPLVDLMGLPDSVLYLHRVEVRLQLQQDDWEGASRAVRQVEEYGMQWGVERLVAWSLMEQVYLHLRRQQLPAAGEALRRLETIAIRYEGLRNCARADIPLYARLARAEMSVAQGDPAPALQTLRLLADEYLRRGQMLRAARLRMREARIAQRIGQPEAISQALRQALRIASQYGLVRVLLDQSAELLPALDALVADAVSLTELERRMATLVLNRLRNAAAEPVTSATAPGTDPESRAGLSAKELEIVDLLAKAFSNKSIGRALNISEGTVKWHLKNIFAKLGAFSREDAVVKARNLRVVR